MMHLKDLTLFARRPKRAGGPDSTEKAEKLVTVGWLCMTATLLVALLLAAYGAV